MERHSVNSFVNSSPKIQNHILKLAKNSVLSSRNLFFRIFCSQFSNLGFGKAASFKSRTSQDCRRCFEFRRRRNKFFARCEFTSLPPLLRSQKFALLQVFTFVHPPASLNPSLGEKCLLRRNSKFAFKFFEFRRSSFIDVE